MIILLLIMIVLVPSLLRYFLELDPYLIGNFLIDLQIMPDDTTSMNTPAKLAVQAQLSMHNSHYHRKRFKMPRSWS